MEKFINKIAKEIFISRKGDLEGLIIVMPGKRAGTFFKKALSELSENPLWSPKLYSIESWVEEISGLTILDRTSLIFEMYLSYVEVFPAKEQDSFETFIRWAPTMLTDFNDVDAYIDKPSVLFNYLHDTKKIELWTPKKTKPSQIVTKYIRLWELLGELFTNFRERLEKQGLAFQGMAYRRASDNISFWMKDRGLKKGSVCYIGFNAMNPCEKNIMKALISDGVAEAYWDADKYYMNDKKQEAGKYLRKHKKWVELQGGRFNWVSSNLINNKKINSFGVPKGIAQAQLAGTLINDLSQKNQELRDVALVLADENLLLPVLDFLPESVDKLNVTMGSALRNTLLFSLFDSLFLLHINRLRLGGEDAGFYYKDLFKVWEHPLFKNAENISALNKLKEMLARENLSFPTKKRILSTCEKSVADWLSPVLNFDHKNHFSLIDNALSIIRLVKENLLAQGRKGCLELEQLFSFAKLFHRIKNLQEKYGFIKELKTIQRLFQQASSIERLSYYGEPLSGLQVMGVLETRNLDFKHIILLSVNEGVIPSGKSEQSFVPFDIRKEVGLPTYMDKDAIFAYHFYRLFQRCSSVTFVYNTQTGDLGSGEKSRFLSQIEHELVPKHPKELSFRQEVLSHPLDRVVRRGLSIAKNKAVIKKLQEIAGTKGFSPSALNRYKSCPLQFYYEKVLNIKNPDSLEEIVEANTLGTVVHRTLEELYKEILNLVLTPEMLKSLLKKVPEKTKEIFSKVFKHGQINLGKNKLIYTVAESFSKSFLSNELSLIKSGNELVIMKVEEGLKCCLIIENLDFPIYLNGSVDRVDLLNGSLRIIDYKTGLVNPGELKSNDMKKIIRDLDRHKAFQLFFYAYLYHKSLPRGRTFEAGIISFRSLKKGFMAASFDGGYENKTKITGEMLGVFEKELVELIKDLFNPNTPFHHNDRKEPCRFCDPEAFL
tara:strand:+ start:2354 stop:5179 length:2826 start_codon:yes stop_codon:yes gene_type:complete